MKKQIIVLLLTFVFSVGELCAAPRRTRNSSRKNQKVTAIGRRSGRLSKGNSNRHRRTVQAGSQSRTQNRRNAQPSRTYRGRQSSMHSAKRINSSRRVVQTRHSGSSGIRQNGHRMQIPAVNSNFVKVSQNRVIGSSYSHPSTVVPITNQITIAPNPIQSPNRSLSNQTTGNNVGRTVSLIPIPFASAQGPVRPAYEPQSSSPQIASSSTAPLVTVLQPDDQVGQFNSNSHFSSVIPDIHGVIYQYVSHATDPVTAAFALRNWIRLKNADNDINALNEAVAFLRHKFNGAVPATDSPSGVASSGAGTSATPAVSLPTGAASTIATVASTSSEFNIPLSAADALKCMAYAGLPTAINQFVTDNRANITTIFSQELQQACDNPERIAKRLAFLKALIPYTHYAIDIKLSRLLGVCTPDEVTARIELFKLLIPYVDLNNLRFERFLGTDLVRALDISPDHYDLMKALIQGGARLVADSYDEAAMEAKINNLCLWGRWQNIAALLDMGVISTKSVLSSYYVACAPRTFIERSLIPALQREQAYYFNMDFIKPLLQSAGYKLKSLNLIDTVKDSQGRTLLQWALCQDVIDNSLVSELLIYGANPNASIPESGITPLMCAAYKNNSLAIVALERAGANIRATNSRGQTAKDYWDEYVRRHPENESSWITQMLSNNNRVNENSS